MLFLAFDCGGFPGPHRFLPLSPVKKEGLNACRHSLAACNNSLLHLLLFACETSFSSFCERFRCLAWRERSCSARHVQHSLSLCYWGVVEILLMFRRFRGRSDSSCRHVRARAPANPGFLRSEKHSCCTACRAVNRLPSRTNSLETRSFCGGLPLTSASTSTITSIISFQYPAIVPFCQ